MDLLNLKTNAALELRLHLNQENLINAAAFSGINTVCVHEAVPLPVFRFKECEATGAESNKQSTTEYDAPRVSSGGLSQQIEQSREKCVVPLAETQPQRTRASAGQGGANTEK